MQKLLTYGLAALMTITLTLSTGCGRGYMRTRTHKPGDRSVTLVKRSKYKGVSGRRKPVTSTRFNRAKK